MKLFSWNVNGIRAVINKGEFARFLQTYDPDILCLQETKAARDQVEIDLPEYHEHFYSAAKKGYSGTAILSKIRRSVWQSGGRGAYHHCRVRRFLGGDMLYAKFERGFEPVEITP